MAIWMATKYEKHGVNETFAGREKYGYADAVIGYSTSSDYLNVLVEPILGGSVKNNLHAKSCEECNENSE